MVINTLTDGISRGVETAFETVTAPFSDPVIRLGVTGLSRAGKTVFITSLVANLMNRGRMPQFLPATQGIIQPAMQLTFDVHATPGTIGAKSYGVFRMREIMSASSRTKNDAMTLYLRPEYNTEQACKDLICKMEYLTLGDICLSSEVLSVRDWRATRAGRYSMFVLSAMGLADARVLSQCIEFLLDDGMIKRRKIPLHDFVEL